MTTGRSRRRSETNPQERIPASPSEPRGPPLGNEKRMAESSNGNGNGNGNSVKSWQWMIPVVSVASIITGALIAFFVNMSSLGSQTSSLNARTSALEQNYNQMAEREMILRTNNATMEAKLLEVETQFCGEDHVRNLTHSQDLRLMAMLWRKVYPDGELPTSDTYYPQICNRNQSGR